MMVIFGWLMIFSIRIHSLRIHGAGIFTYIGIIWKITLEVNVGKYSIHGSSGIGYFVDGLICWDLYLS